MHCDGIILATNRAARDLYRLGDDGAVGQPLLDYIAPEARATILERIALKSNTPYEAIARRADGTTFPAAVVARSTTFRGRPARLAAIRDLTELRQMQSSLAFADRMASIGTLAAGVAHEINNPLTFIMLNLEDAMHGLEAGQAGSPGIEAIIDMLRDAQVGAGRVRDIVRDLKTFSREDDDVVGSVELGPVIVYATRMANAELRHRAKLEVHVPELPRVRGNETRLGQVFLNLVVNAAQAIAQGAADENTVTVSAERREDVVVVSITDTGAGIAPEVLGRIFDPFVTTKSQGTGLGLPICHGIVTRLGGTITVESERGRGTTFRVTLPIADPPSRAEAPPSSRSREEDHEGGRVLIVDDEAALLRSASRLLMPTYEVVTMRSAKLVLAALERGEHFDVILCDLLMPEMTGMALDEAVRERFPAVASRMVFLTGGVFTKQAEEFLATTHRPCIRKPFTAEALRGAVRSVLDTPVLGSSA
jgi:PAS domain S-box-containing protein